MNDILQYFLLLPLLGFLISLLLPETKEKIISWTAFSTVFLQLISLVVFIIIWLFYGANDFNLKEIKSLGLPVKLPSLQTSSKFLITHQRMDVKTNRMEDLYKLISNICIFEFTGLYTPYIRIWVLIGTPHIRSYGLF